MGPVPDEPGTENSLVAAACRTVRNIITSANRTVTGRVWWVSVCNLCSQAATVSPYTALGAYSVAGASFVIWNIANIMH